MSFPKEMDTELMQKLEEFDLDLPESKLTFSGRLARENGWSTEFTARAIQEYRRFLYLCARAGHPVTPSDEVDQVWHLHLCYTESYWHDLCRDTLGFPLHHGPTKGGLDEQKKFHGWYSKTLESYREAFGTEPPSEIWPAPKHRFRSVRFERIDRDSYFVVPKWLLGRPAVIAAFSALLIGCELKWRNNSDSVNLMILCTVAGIILIYAFVKCIKHGGGGGGGGGCGTGCTGCGGGCGGCGS